MAGAAEELRTAEHGVLATQNPSGAIDLVPVVFAVSSDGRIVIPTDTVKAKRTTRLQRIVNLEADPRCTLLVEHYESDWSKLWWVRAQGMAFVKAPTPDELELLAEKYPSYRDPASVVSIIELTPDRITGWRAG